MGRRGARLFARARRCPDADQRPVDAQEESRSQQLFFRAQQDKQSADPNPGDRLPNVIVFPVSTLEFCSRVEMISALSHP